MSKSLLHIVLILVTTGLLLLATNFFINWYTRHGDAIEVPNVQGMSFYDAKQVLKKHHLELRVIDSTFDKSHKPLSILYQNPLKGAKVKKDRKIYLTINSSNPPSVKIPNIIDNSRRQAELILSSWGLNIGQLIYIPDMAKDAVLGIQMNGKIVEPGKTVKKGASIDLVLGDGIGSQITEVPPLIGLTVLEAQAVLEAVHINLGNLIADGPIADTMNAYIYNQDPMYGVVGALASGNAVKLYITDTPVEFTQP
ncbi:MAG: PASTA domain-containing protein [Chitinophagales bacterium]|nr:PASTA domain-containing protein [Chitinophagales bacterium]